MDSISPTQYFGVKDSYPKIVNESLSDEIKNIYMDVVFDELIENKSFKKEAQLARKRVIKNPSSFPNLSLKYKGFFKK